MLLGALCLGSEHSAADVLGVLAVALLVSVCQQLSSGLTAIRLSVEFAVDVSDPLLVVRNAHESND